MTCLCFEGALGPENVSLIDRAFIYVGHDTIEHDRLGQGLGTKQRRDQKLLQEDLLKQGMTMANLRKKQKELIIVRSMRARATQGRVKIAPKALRDAYNEQKAKFKSDEKVHIRMIVLDVPAPSTRDTQVQKANDLAAQLKKGDDFATLARVSSDGFYAKKGGDWGSVDPKELRKEIAEAVAELKDGEISPIIDAGDQLYIIKLEERQIAGFKTYEEVQPQLEREIRRKEEARLYSEWIDTLRADAYIEIIPASRQR